MKTALKTNFIAANIDFLETRGRVTHGKPSVGITRN